MARLLQSLSAMQLRNARHLTSLRVSLLASLGILPLACGGNTQGSPGPDAGGSNATAGAGGKAPTNQARACTSPRLDPATQLMLCDEGYSHRPTPTTCAALGAAEEAPAAGGAPSDLPAQVRATGHEKCMATAAEPQCAEFTYGFCRSVQPSADCFGGCCFSGCVTDADCGEGLVCLCGSTRSPTGGECVRSDCKTDGDCAGGFRCATSDDLCGDPLPHFSCQKAADECSTSADCEGAPCSDNGSGTRTCFQGACGRPFLVESQVRMAGVVESPAWLGSGIAQPRVDHLAAAERAAFATHWLHLGQMEHASIAAFARFSLQLLALGAPPELVDACTQALADETLHAKLCFQLASAYADCPLGPGRLDISGSLTSVTLADIVDLVIAEGCFGETSAALEALEAADTAGDPVVRDVYARIATDEQRHAELAFRFLRWALSHDAPTVRKRIAASIATPPSDHQAVRAVILPCLSALLGRPQGFPDVAQA